MESKQIYDMIIIGGGRGLYGGYLRRSGRTFRTGVGAAGPRRTNGHHSAHRQLPRFFRRGGRLRFGGKMQNQASSLGQ